MRSLGIGLLLGLGFTLVLNAGSIRAFVENRLTVADLGAELGSPDETYYFAVIQDVRDGHWSMGNSSLYEHRDAPTVAGYGLLPQGMIAAATDWSIASIVLLGDIVFPLLITCIVFLILRRFLLTDFLSAVVAIGYMSWWSTLWQRTMNPQVTMLLFALALLGIVSDQEGRKLWLRGMTAGVLFFVQPMYAAYILALEGVIALVELCKERSFKVITRRIWMAVFVLAAALLQIWLQSGADAAALLDTYHRRGLIESHLPTGFSMQILIVVLLGFLWTMRKRLSEKKGLIAILLVTGLIILNQSIVHGKDAVFGLYYRVPLSLVFWITGAWFIGQFFLYRYQKVLAIIVTFFTCISMLQLIHGVTLPRAEGRSEEFVRSGIPELLDAIQELPKDTVILAPIEISNLIPVLTTQYPFFTQYAHFEYGSDQEMAERYLIQNFVFPLPPEMTVEGDPVAFGIYAGNRAARVKTLCRIRSRFTDPCTQELALFLAHPELHTYIRVAKPDLPGTLKKYGTTTIVTDRSLPQSLENVCNISQKVGSYSILRCSL